MVWAIDFGALPYGFVAGPEGSLSSSRLLLPSPLTKIPSPVSHCKASVDS